MKRFVWLALFAFCTALAQVQPVQPVGLKSNQCGCCADTPSGSCEHAGMKGMENCVPCTTCVPAFCTLLPATAIVVLANPAEISRLNWLAESGRTRADPPLLTPPRLAG